MTLRDLWQSGRDTLALAAKPTPELDARLLLIETLNQTTNSTWSTTLLLSHDSAEASAQTIEHFQRLLERRQQHEPVALITGHKAFFGFDFVVTKEVLQPRPASEAMIEAALNYIAQSSSKKRWLILDIGTGSGALAISLAKNLAKQSVPYEIIATDISPAALAVAEQNSQRLNAAGIHFLRSNFLANVPPQPFDIILANLPYLPTNLLTALEPEIAFEPELALLGGPDGLDCYRQLRQHIDHYVTNQTVLIFECSAAQKAELADLFQPFSPIIVT